jgi:DHA1 family tetracycline resistance protein-like MFS transporter
MRFIMVTVLIDMLSIGVIVPVLPALVGSFTANPAEQTYWYTAVSVAFALASFFGAPLLGALSDHYGRRPILLLGFCGLGLNFFSTALASSAWMLVASRVVGGAMQANAAVANAYVADITQPEERGKRFGMLGAMFGIGFILGPVIGGILGAISLQLPFFFAGSLAMVNLVYGYFVLPESLPPERRRPVQWARANPFTSLYELTRLKGAGWLLGVIACANLAQFSLYTTWVLYTTHRFGWNTAQNGWSLFAVGVVAAVVQGGLLGRLLKRFGASRLTVMGLLSSTTAFTLWGLATQGWMMYPVIFANLLGSAVAASVQSLISSSVDGSQQGQTLGAVSALGSLMAVVAPLAAGPLFALVSHLPAQDWRMGAPMFLCALLQALALMFAICHFRSTQGPRAEPAAATP